MSATIPSSLRLLAIALSIVWSGSIAIAQSRQWVSTGGPLYDADYRFLAIGKGLVVVASHQLVEFSSNGGSRWTRTSHTWPQGFLIYDVAIDSSGGVIVGGHGGPGGGVLFRTTDQGATWRNMNLPAASGSALAVGGDGAIYATGPNEIALFRTTNFGATWQTLDIGKVLDGGITIIGDSTLLVSGVVDGTRGVYRSVDRGATWTPTTGIGNSIVMMFDHDDSSTVFSVVTSTPGGRLRQSYDGGVSWSPVALLPNTSEKQSVHVDSAESIFVGTLANGIYRSVDRGLTWESRSRGLRTLDVRAIDRAPDGTLYAVTPIGAYRSTDDGELWTRVHGNPAVARIDELIATPWGELLGCDPMTGFYRSPDAGATWTENSLGMRGGMRSVAVTEEGGIVLGMVSPAITYRLPGVPEWRPVVSFDAAVTALATATDIDHETFEIYAGTARGSVYVSTDNGMKWTLGNINQIADFGPVLGLVSTDNGDVFAATERGVFVHRAEGEGWTRVLEPVGRMFECITVAGSTIVVAGGEYIWASKDGGTTWAQLPDFDRSLTQIGFHALGGLPDGTILASIGGSGTGTGGYRFMVWRLSPGSESWTRMDEGLDPMEPVTSFALLDGKTLFAGALGVYRFSGSLSNVRDDAPRAGSISMRVAPLPIAAEGSLDVDLPRAGRYVLSIHDIDGASLGTISDLHLNAGVHRLAIDVSTLSTGSYILELRGPDTIERAVIQVVR